MSRGRIFLLGDSFTENLYKIDCLSDNSISNYIKILRRHNQPDPLYFSDYLELWGYEIYNFGHSGCSVMETILDFAKIDTSFREGDRIIINWTSVTRFNWIDDNGYIINIDTNADRIDNIIVKKFFQQQIINRQYSLDSNADIKTKLIPFMNYLIDLHSKYKPIVWAPFGNDFGDKWFFYDPTKFPNFHCDKLRINDETNGIINDYHFSRYGNYYLAIIFRNILENAETEYYIKEDKLIKKIHFEIQNCEKFDDNINWSI